jgi:putative endonuclease
LSRFKGNLAEDEATIYLTSLGFTILKRNFYTKFGEIDIIAQKDDVLHFIEVKSGSTFEPIYNITPTKLNRVIKSAQSYLKQHHSDQAFEIDALIVDNNGCELIENITF